MPPALDRRVRRSRAVLMAAAKALVIERGTADVPVSAITEAADVSRRLLYQQFGDLETLLLETARDLVRSELLPRIADTPSADVRDERMLAVVEHMAANRPFYRPLLTSSCAFALTKALNSLFLPVNLQGVRLIYGERLDARTTEDLAAFLTGGWGDFICTWVVEGPEPLDPGEFADRLLRIGAALLPQGLSTSTNERGPVDDN